MSPGEIDTACAAVESFLRSELPHAKYSDLEICLRVHAGKVALLETKKAEKRKLDGSAA